MGTPCVDRERNTHAARAGAQGGPTVGHPMGTVLIELLVLPVKGALDGVQGEGTDR